MSEEKYRFVVEWYDQTLKVKRQFLLSFFPSDGSVDMYDIVSKRIFLRRMRCEAVDVSDLFIGSVINILSRQLVIIDFGDKWTAEKFSNEVELTLIFINNSGFSYLGKIISILEANELNVNRGKIIHKDKYGFNSSFFSESLEMQFAVLELRSENAINLARKLIYPDMPSQIPLRANMGELMQHCLVPKDVDTAIREINLFFPATKEVHCNSVIYKNSTCCIIKPHALRERIVGVIMQDIIDSGYIISALEVVTFNMSNASEFLEIYKGVVTEYKEMVGQLMSGPCIALEISRSNCSNKIVTEFRTLVGPADPEIAKKLRPGTLRAKYGHDIVKNAVHCTDLPEDAILELDYIFRVLNA